MHQHGGSVGDHLEPMDLIDCKIVRLSVSMDLAALYYCQKRAVRGLH